MHVLITGAAGMVGRKLIARLVKDGGLNGQPIERLTLTDVGAPEKPAGFTGKGDFSTSDLAAPGVFSGIIREPLSGQEAILPVAETVRHTHASPRSAVNFLVHAAGLTREQLGSRMKLSSRGGSC